MAEETSFWDRLRSSAPYLAIVILGALALANRHAYLDVQERDLEQPEPVPPISRIQDVYRAADRVEGCDEPDGPCRLLDEDGDLVARVLFSDRYAEDITGYGGPVSLVIEVGDDEMIRRVELLDHSETASFVESVREAQLLERWDGLSMDEVLEEDVDAVAGATLTSQAIIESVRATIAHHADNRIEAADVAAGGISPIVRQILTVVFLIPGVIAAFSSDFRRKFQTAVLLSNVIVLGFVARALLSLALLRGMILHGVATADSWNLLVVLAVFAAIAIATGTNVWCTQICPYGSLQRLAGKLGKGMSVKLPGPMRTVFRHTRPLILSLAFIAAYVAPGIDLSQVEPFAAFLILGAPIASIVIAVLFVLLSLVQPRLWCRSFCPTGMLLDTVRVRKRT